MLYPKDFPFVRKAYPFRGPLSVVSGSDGHEGRPSIVICFWRRGGVYPRPCWVQFSRIAPAQGHSG